MSTITTLSALQRFTTSELRRLEFITRQQIARAAPGSPERCDALAALRTIRIALAIRAQGPAGPR